MTTKFEKFIYIFKNIRMEVGGIPFYWGNEVWSLSQYYRQTGEDFVSFTCPIFSTSWERKKT